MSPCWPKMRDSSQASRQLCKSVNTAPPVFLIDLHRSVQSTSASIFPRAFLPRRKVSVTQKVTVPFPHFEWFPNQKLTNSHAVCALVANINKSLSHCVLLLKPRCHFSLRNYLTTLFDRYYPVWSQFFIPKVSWFRAWKSLIELHAKQAQHSEEHWGLFCEPPGGLICKTDLRRHSTFTGLTAHQAAFLLTAAEKSAQKMM